MKSILLVLFAFLLVLSSRAQAQQPSPSIPPADFKIIAIAGGVSSWSTETKVEIDAQGKGAYYTMSAESREKGEFKKVNEFTIDRLALKAIYGAVAKADFFKLKEQYVRPDVLDGSFAEITVSLHGKTYTVHTQNIAVPALDDINIAINLATPPDNKIHYNAIL